MTPKVEVSDGVRVASNSRALGHTTPEAPSRTFEIALPVRECTSTIEAGFQTEWGRIDEIDLTLYSGAGFGSAWATIHHGNKTYAIKATDIVAAFLAAVE